MLELFVIAICLSWPLALMRAGAALSRYLRDREIDRELAEGGW